MSVKRRRTETVDASAVDDWSSQAGQASSTPTVQPQSPTPQRAAIPVNLPAHRRRARSGPKKDAVSFRFNAAQRDLLNVAVAHEDLSQQQLLESLIWETLEDRYGELAPIDE